MTETAATSEPRLLPLDALHRARGARMGAFAGYQMPIQYTGVLAEHAHTRESAGLFDVSHMGQAVLEGADHATVALALEAMVPADILGLAPGQQRYTQLTNGRGGIVDDLMVTRPPGADGQILLVVNAGRKDVDYAWIRERLPAAVRLTIVDDRALLALQGPRAVETIARLCPELGRLMFMTGTYAPIDGVPCFATRSGYTGEDGVEISVPAKDAERLANTILDLPGVALIGLGARDSLRLEAGLPLWGNDIDEDVTPVEASLAWSIGKARRTGAARAGGFPGSVSILKQLESGAERYRVGIRPEGRAPAREGTPVLAPDGSRIGTITSGTFGPTVGAPVAMAHIDAAYRAPDTAVHLEIRGKAQPARVCRMPFVPHRYHR